MAGLTRCINVYVSGEDEATKVRRGFLLTDGVYLNPKLEFPGIWEASIADVLDPTKEPWFMQVLYVDENGATVRFNQKAFTDVSTELRVAPGARMRLQLATGQFYNLEFGDFKMVPAWPTDKSWSQH